MNVYTKKVDLSLDRDEFNQKYGRKKSLSTFTLGCKVNQYETQALKEKFEKAGYEVVAENAFADVYVINTCTVTSLSDKKSRQYIRRVKRINPDSITAVVGCYAQVSPAEAAGIEGVNIVAGTNEKNNLVSYIERYVSNHINGQGEQGGVQAETHIIPLEELTQYEDTGTITSMDSRVRAYIKVQEGCNRFCSYCMIPYARGAVRSRRASEIVEEAENLLHQGVKEIVLTGINTALYGMEKDEKVTGQVDGEREETGKKGAERELYGIEVIVKLLNELPGDFRIRIGSLEPTVVNKAYAERLLKYEKLCPHFHLSLQSGSDGIIKAMNRHYTGADYLDLVNMLRGKDACFGVTTDIIVGFPGETEENFKESLRMVEQAKFLKVHSFKYSKRNGTVAAAMKGHLSPEVKQRRSKELEKVATEVTKAFLLENIESVRTLLVERYDEKTGYYQGYTENYIYVYCKPDVPPNDDEQGKEASLLNEFVKVTLKKLYKDGMMAIVQHAVS